MSSHLVATAVPIRVSYLGLRLSPKLLSAIEQHAQRLADNKRQVEGCALHVGHWQLHQYSGRLYRVSLEIELTQGRGMLVTTRESELNAGPDALLDVLQQTFDASLTRVQRAA